MSLRISFAQDWSNWRGPNYNGLRRFEPVRCQAKFDSEYEHVKWKFALPGPSAGTPIIHGQLCFYFFDRRLLMNHPGRVNC